MEQKYTAAPDKIFALLTDPKWVEARCLELGELSVSVKAKKAGGGVTLTMKRQVKREITGLAAKVISPISNLEFEEKWSAPDDEGVRVGSLTITAVGQPVKISADFELLPSGKGSVYRILHKAKCSVPLIGGAIEKFVLGQVEQGCADEFAYTVAWLKKNK